MEESKISLAGLYVSLASFIVAILALLRDYFDFKGDIKEFWEYMVHNSYLPIIILNLFFFIIGYFFKKYTTVESKIKVVKKTKVLIAFTERRIYGNDSLIITNSNFSNNIKVVENIKIDELRRLLMSNKFDIVQLGINIDNSNKLVVDGDSITSEALIKLLDLSDTKLLVLGSCNSVNLTANTSNKINMIAATGNLESKLFEKWEESFYALLAKGNSFSKAFEISKMLYEELPIEMVLVEDFKFEK